MRKDKDEITLKEAAELLEAASARNVYPHIRAIVDAEGYRQAEEREKRLREVGNAGATLDVMLSASRHGKIVRGKP